MTLLPQTIHVFILSSVLGIFEPSPASVVSLHLKKTSPNESFRKCQDFPSRPLFDSHAFPEPESREARAGTTDTEEGSSEEWMPLLSTLFKLERYWKNKTYNNCYAFLIPDTDVVIQQFPFLTEVSEIKTRLKNNIRLIHCVFSF